jgi:hypothetical protein
MNTGTAPFLKPPTERIRPKLAKICRHPKNSRNTVINANIGNTSNTLHIQVPSHHVQQKRLLEHKALNWKQWAFIYGYKSWVRKLYYKWVRVYWGLPYGCPMGVVLKWVWELGTGVVLQIKKMGLSLLELESSTFNPTNLP